MSRSRRPNRGLPEAAVWLRTPPIAGALIALLVGSALLESKNASILHGEHRSATAVWTALVTGYGPQGLALGAAMGLGAFMAATRAETGIDRYRRTLGFGRLAVQLDTMAVALWIGLAAFVVMILGSALGLELGARMAGLRPPVVGAAGFAGSRIVVRDGVITATAAVVGAALGAPTRNGRLALSLVAPLAIVPLDQVGQLLALYPRLGAIASWTPAGLLVTVAEGSAGRSFRSTFPGVGTRSALVGLVALLAWLSVAIVATTLLADREVVRARRVGPPVAPIACCAVLLGVLLPPLFRADVPWRYRTDWLSARKQGTSSLDVVEQFVSQVRGDEPIARDLLLTSRGADPVEDPFFEPIRSGTIREIGPESRMDGPDAVPVEVRVGSVVVSYRFTLEVVGSTWRIADVQARRSGR